MKLVPLHLFPLLLAALISACAGKIPDPAQLHADEQSLIRATIADPARAERIFELTEQRDRLIDETRLMLREFRQETGTLNADYDARRAVVLEIIDVFNHERAEKQLRFIDLIDAMKRTMTSEEWKVVADFQLRFFDPENMLSRPTQTKDMPTVMLEVFLLGGGLMGGAMLQADAVSSIQNRIRTAVGSEADGADALQVAADLGAEVEQYNRDFIDAGDSLRQIYVNHDAGSRRLLSMLEALNLAWYASQSRNMVLRDRLREAMNPDQWASVFPQT